MKVVNSQAPMQMHNSRATSVRKAEVPEAPPVEPEVPPEEPPEEEPQPESPQPPVREPAEPVPT